MNIIGCDKELMVSKGMERIINLLKQVVADH